MTFGLQKLTLLDYPGHVACTVFVSGCNFRCPFCHNASLVLSANEEGETEEALFAFLKKRVGILDGVCITGGEPTGLPDLPGLIRKIRALGFSVKLDTNGSRPAVLKSLLDNKLLDYVAMDIKNSREHYARTAGIAALDLAPIEESVSLLRQGTVPYEFRTTVVKELHHEADFASIGAWLSGDEPYFLQQFVDSGDLISDCYTACTKEEMEHFRTIVAPYLPNAGLRGV